MTFVFKVEIIKMYFHLYYGKLLALQVKHTEFSRSGLAF